MLQKIGTGWDGETEEIWKTRKNLEKWLKWAKAGAPSKLKESLTQAVFNGDYQSVAEWLGKAADINAVDQDGMTPLLLAIYKRDIRMVQLLIASRVDVNLATAEGRSPIQDAAAANLVDMVKLLVEKGADVNTAAGSGGWSALQYAAYYGYEELMDYLLSVSGIDAQQRRSYDGRTPMHTAAQRGQEQVMRRMLERHIPFDVTSDSGLTPMHVAAREGYVNIVKMLHEAGADINNTDKQGATPLDWARRYGFKDVIQYLESLKAQEHHVFCAEEDAKESARLNAEGLEYLEEGKLDPARRSFEDAVAKCPKLAQPHANLSMVAMILEHNPQKGLAEIKTAMKLDPGQPKYYLDAGKILFSMGEAESAKFYLCQFLRLNQDPQVAERLIKDVPALETCPQAPAGDQ